MISKFYSMSTFYDLGFRYDSREDKENNIKRIKIHVKFSDFLIFTLGQIFFVLFDSGINEGNSYIPVDGRIAIIKQQQQQQL